MPNFFSDVKPATPRIERKNRRKNNNVKMKVRDKEEWETPTAACAVPKW
jgi:hypothetical protein